MKKKTYKEKNQNVKLPKSHKELNKLLNEAWTWGYNSGQVDGSCSDWNNSTKSPYK